MKYLYMYLYLIPCFYLNKFANISQIFEIFWQVKYKCYSYCDISWHVEVASQQTPKQLGPAGCYLSNLQTV